MIYDGNELFTAAAGDLITVSAASTNVLDLSTGRDLGATRGAVRPQIFMAALTGFTSSNANATLNVQVQVAPDNGSGSPGGWSTILETSPQYLGQLVAGQRVFDADLSGIAQPYLAPSPTTTFSCSSGASTITVASNSGIQFGQLAIPATAGIIVPGTTVTGISGTTITLSANTTAAASAGSAISFAPDLATSAAAGLPRYLRLNYVVANGPFTGGALFGGIVLDSDSTIICPSAALTQFPVRT